MAKTFKPLADLSAKDHARLDKNCHHIVKCALTQADREHAVDLMREGNNASYAQGGLALQGECAQEALRIRKGY
jgi:hypothetical protein